MERDNKKRKRDTNKMKNTYHEITIKFSWEDVQVQAEEQGVTLSEKQAKKQFDAMAWGLREALIEAGNQAIADNLGVA
jgi:ribosomal protein L6P/L9E